MGSPAGGELPDFGSGDGFATSGHRHVQAAVQTFLARGLACAGIVLNQLGDEMDTAMITNKSVVEDLTGAPLLEHVIHGQDAVDPEVFLDLVRGR